jgi:CheY-like chemotaxis protein
MGQSYARSIEILLVEDNPADVRLTQEALKEGRVRNSLSVAQDGVEAMAFLRREGAYARAPRPDLVLLDINLPRMNGHEVLAEIKSDPLLKRIPVLVLTTSSADEDIHKAYGLHANCYITKPVGMDQFIRAIESLDDFWLSVATLPGTARND